MVEGAVRRICDRYDINPRFITRSMLAICSIIDNPDNLVEDELKFPYSLNRKDFGLVFIDRVTGQKIGMFVYKKDIHGTIEWEQEKQVYRSSLLVKTRRQFRAWVQSYQEWHKKYLVEQI